MRVGDPAASPASMRADEAGLRPPTVLVSVRVLYLIGPAARDFFFVRVSSATVEPGNSTSTSMVYGVRYEYCRGMMCMVQWGLGMG